MKGCRASQMENYDGDMKRNTFVSFHFFKSTSTRSSSRPPKAGPFKGRVHAVRPRTRVCVLWTRSESQPHLVSSHLQHVAKKSTPIKCDDDKYIAPTVENTNKTKRACALSAMLLLLGLSHFAACPSLHTCVRDAHWTAGTNNPPFPPFWKLLLRPCVLQALQTFSRRHTQHGLGLGPTIPASHGVLCPPTPP